MAQLRVGHSYWLDVFRKRVPSLPSLRGRHQADIAIVGGGVTGCAAGLLFARAGAYTGALAQTIGCSDSTDSPDAERGYFSA